MAALCTCIHMLWYILKRFSYVGDTEIFIDLFILGGLSDPHSSTKLETPLLSNFPTLFQHAPVEKLRCCCHGSSNWHHREVSECALAAGTARVFVTFGLWRKPMVCSTNVWKHGFYFKETKIVFGHKKFCMVHPQHCR